MNSSYPRFSSYEAPIIGLASDTSENSQDASNWAVPWSDLMMTMFILFAVLFMFANAKRDFFREIREGLGGSSTARQEIDLSQASTMKQEPRYEKSHAGVSAQQQMTLRPDDDAADLARAMANPQVIAFTLDRPILFSHLSARLEPEALMSLKTVLPVIRKSNLDVQVIGYTDGLPVHTPNFAGNWELATARAMTVAHWLMDEGKVSPARITVSGRGPHDPRVPNISRVNRRQNRRVEILLTRNRQGAKS